MATRMGEASGRAKDVDGEVVLGFTACLSSELEMYSGLLCLSASSIESSRKEVYFSRGLLSIGRRVPSDIDAAHTVRHTGESNRGKTGGREQTLCQRLTDLVMLGLPVSWISAIRYQM